MMAGNRSRKTSIEDTDRTSHAQYDSSLKQPDKDGIYELEWTEYSKADYHSLDGSQLVFVNKALDRIRLLGMAAGAPLAGNLVGCRKLKHRKLGLRIVFCQSEKGIQIVQIVAIGSRSNAGVYKQAEYRLS